MKIIGIVGPTAAGKTQAAIRVAEAVSGEIISCDSVAIYRGLDIGSAKPTLEDRTRVPHHVIDVAWPDERFSAARWAELADRAASAIERRGKAVVVVGGTGLYLRAWLWGLAPAPPADPMQRARMARRPSEMLWAELSRVDPVSARRTGPRDRVRLCRALEVWEMTGVPLSEWWGRHIKRKRYDALLWGITPPREELYARIDARVDAMIEAGWLDEVRDLQARYGDGACALRSVGYAELCAHLSGQQNLEDAIALVKRRSRNYARRQLTWFRGSQTGCDVSWYPRAASLPVDQAVRFLAQEEQSARP